MKPNSQQAAEAFFADLDRDIQETPGEKEARLEREAQERETRREEKLEKIRGLAGKSVEVPLTLIDTTQNIRALIDTESDGFRALVEEIKNLDGVLQHPVATVIDDGNGLRLLCLAGHRRILAAQRAGHKTITIAVRRVETEAERIAISLGENLIREDLHALDVAAALSRLKALGASHDDLARRFGKNTKTIGHFIKMHDEWPKDARDLIRTHQETFNTSFLLRVAKRKLDANGVLDVIRGRLNGPNPKPRTNRLSQLETYFAEAKVSKRDQQAVLNALKALKLLP
jgi:ParB/RepB/Spo0J family partition protein